MIEDDADKYSSCEDFPDLLQITIPKWKISLMFHRTQPPICMRISRKECKGLTVSTLFCRNEKDALINQNGDGVPVMEVFLIEPSCQKETKMNPKIWPMQKGQKRNAKVSYMYSLGKHWNEVVSGNGFEEGMTVQVWAFQVDGNLGFALVRVGTCCSVPQEGSGA
ncbi:hypothetical protein Acr_11g0012100 [Actinidia rufa]|uniref:TF-B3 domain-containing protein n=1 Tax=Actinidia rufa TaxID=165716 RepID=A0A7J0FDX2_9ERIC|nr:hypothetical protein Acr_11g0012100 [Actinidia rufa]